MTAAQAKALREPFKPEQIGKLPKPTKKENPKGHCNECGGWHGLPAVHLDYVGHAAVTDRLLSVDPEWTWEPAAVGPNGEPLVIDGGLWIKLTVAGVTKYGFGDSSMGHGPKEMIGDAIRNAAMRFGVGLDLWAKESLNSDGAGADGHAAPSAQPAETPEQEWGRKHRHLEKLVGDLEKSSTPPPEGNDSWRGYAKSYMGVKSMKNATIRDLDKAIDHLDVPFG
jgi:hypothetical protein